VTKRRVLLSWSSGKDSAWALHVLRQDPTVEVAALLTTINEAFDRVAMHAVRRPLVEGQAAAARLPLWTVSLPWPCSNAAYESCMRAAVARAVAEGFTHVAFGDLFLEDVRRYREERLSGSGLQPLFPLWARPTGALAREMLLGGLKARLSCVNPQLLDPAFASREYDAALLADLPENIDPCGERGEFHTFAYAGPMFDEPIAVVSGDVVDRDGFVFADLLPSPESARSGSTVSTVEPSTGSGHPEIIEGRTLTRAREIP
jgi:diphthamide synthase (EF-2-diphthine--ammonia ligase)